MEFYRKYSSKFIDCLNDSLCCLFFFSIINRQEWTSSIVWSIFCPSQFLSGLTINPLNLHTVLSDVLLFPLDLFFLSAIPRSLNTFMLRSANWNVMISFTWVSWKYANLSWSARPSLHYKYLSSSSTSNANSVLKPPTVTLHLRDYNIFLYTLF